MTHQQIVAFNRCTHIRSVEKGERKPGSIYYFLIQPNGPIDDESEWNVQNEVAPFYYWIKYRQLKAASLKKDGWIHMRDGYKILPLTITPVNLSLVGQIDNS